MPDVILRNFDSFNTQALRAKKKSHASHAADEIPVARPFANETTEDMTEFARADASLGRGVLPDTLNASLSGPQKFMQQWEKTHSYNTSKEPELANAANLENHAMTQAYDRQVFLREMWQSVAKKTLAGGVLGLTMVLRCPLAPVVTAFLAGATQWAFWHRQREGTAALVQDGEARRAHFYRDPQHVVKTPEELRTVLYASGVLGDVIAPQTPEASPMTDVPTDPTLLQLEADRRLVADLGHRSKYGHQTLDQIDATTAQSLLAQGHPIFVVRQKEVHDVSRQLVMDAALNDRRQSNSEHHVYTERHFSYDLTQVDDPTRLASIEPAAGLPDGLAGVYKNSHEVVQSVHMGSAREYVSIEPGALAHQHHETGVLKAQDVAHLTPSVHAIVAHISLSPNEGQPYHMEPDQWMHSNH